MSKILAPMTALLALVYLAAPPSQAQEVCGLRTQFLEKLDTSYAQHPTALGLASNGSVLEIMSSQKGSWTILVTRPDGFSCVVATGEAWQALPPPPATSPNA
jgi:hypothetical protein